MTSCSDWISTRATWVSMRRGRQSAHWLRCPERLCDQRLDVGLPHPADWIRRRQPCPGAGRTIDSIVLMAPLRACSGSCDCRGHRRYGRSESLGLHPCGFCDRSPVRSSLGLDGLEQIPIDQWPACSPLRISPLNGTSPNIEAIAEQMGERSARERMPPTVSPS